MPLSVEGRSERCVSERRETVQDMLDTRQPVKSQRQWPGLTGANVETVSPEHGSTLCFRCYSVDLKYQVWKLGVVFTDNVSHQ